DRPVARRGPVCHDAVGRLRGGRGDDRGGPAAERGDLVEREGPPRPRRRDRPRGRGGRGQPDRLPTPPAIGAFSVINAAAVSNALTESQIDAQYAIAILATTNINTVAKITNIIFAARQSNTIRNALRANAIAASSSGCYGRAACIRTPMNTSPQVALSTTAAPGVGAYRADRVIYCYPQANTFVPI